MSKQSFMRINDTPEERLHFSILESAISEKLVDVSQYFDFDIGFFDIRKDSRCLHSRLINPIESVIRDLEERFGIGVKLCTNSLYRKPYSILTMNGVSWVDYNDLTVPLQKSHHGGCSGDLSYSMMWNKYKIPKEAVIAIMTKNGFTRPFLDYSKPQNEEWHWSYVK
jgi:hypothetical protein